MRKRQSQLQLPDHPLSSSSSSPAPHPFVSSSLIQLSCEDRAECALPDPAELTGGITGLIWRERKRGRAKKGGGEIHRKRRRATRVRDGSREERVSLVFRAESARNRLLDPIYSSLLFLLSSVRSFESRSILLCSFLDCLLSFHIFLCPTVHLLLTQPGFFFFFFSASWDSLRLR